MNQLSANKRQWELLFECVMTLNYGDVIHHQDISEIIGEPHGSSKYQSVIYRAKKSLLKQGKDIESIRGQGYRVVMPDDYSVKSVATYKQGFKKFKKATDLLTYAPLSHMSEEGRLAHRNVADRTRTLYAIIAGGYTELNLLVKKPSAFFPENVSRT